MASKDDITHRKDKGQGHSDDAYRPAQIQEGDEEREGLRTSDAVSPNVSANQVLGSTIGFLAIYVALGAVWLLVLDRKIKQGPESPAGREPPDGDDLLQAVGRRAVHEGRMTGGNNNQPGSP